MNRSDVSFFTCSSAMKQCRSDDFSFLFQSMRHLARRSNLRGDNSSQSPWQAWRARILRDDVTATPPLPPPERRIALALSVFRSGLTFAGGKPLIAMGERKQPLPQQMAIALTGPRGGAEFG
jgi:hypothetical protein